MFCRKCGNQIPDDSEFCPKCGTRNIIEAESKGVSLSKPAAGSNTLAVAKKPTACPNCGKTLLTEWQYCPNCTEDNPGYDHSGAENPTNTGLRCPGCGKSLLTDWENCPYCLENNPFFKVLKPQTPAAPPVVVVQPPQQPQQPQVIIREVIKEERKPEGDGCATSIGKAVIGLVSFIFIMSLLGSCFSCAGCA